MGDLLVIENKAGETVPGAVVQLSGYVEQAEAAYPGVDVYGWLASTTSGESTDAAAAVAGFATWTCGELGFLDHLWTGGNTEQPIREFLEVFNDASPWDRDDEL